MALAGLLVVSRFDLVISLVRYKLSCRFINSINDSIAHQVYYDKYEDAYRDARHGKLIGIIYFATNFTDSLADIHINGQNANNGSFDNKDIQVFLDKTDQQITFFMERKLRQTFKEFAEQLMSDCGFPRALGNIPINFLEPVYGSYEQEFTDFVAPGVVMT